jgi:hypothetical protein
MDTVRINNLSIGALIEDALLTASCVREQEVSVYNGSVPLDIGVRVPPRSNDPIMAGIAYLSWKVQVGKVEELDRLYDEAIQRVAWLRLQGGV